MRGHGSQEAYIFSLFCVRSDAELGGASFNVKGMSSLASDDDASAEGDQGGMEAAAAAAVPRWVLDRCRLQLCGGASGEGAACKLCLAPLERGGGERGSDGGVAVFPCGAVGRRPHAFHRECLEDWLARYADLGFAPTCPACRRWLHRDRAEAQPASPHCRWQPADVDIEDDEDDEEEEGEQQQQQYYHHRQQQPPQPPRRNKHDDEEGGGGGGGDY